MDKKNLPIGTVLFLPAADLVNEVMSNFRDYLERLEDETNTGSTKLFERDLIARALKTKPVTSGETIVGINHSSVADLVAAMYLDLLNSHANWHREQGDIHHFNKQWLRMVSGWDIGNVDANQRLFVSVFRSVQDQIDERLSEFVEEKESWHVWYARRFGLDVLIEKGPDFRVLDWERRMRLGIEHLKAKNENEPIPEGAWLPDEDARRFTELMSVQQTQPSMLGQSSLDQFDAKMRGIQERLENRRSLDKGTL